MCIEDWNVLQNRRVLFDASLFLILYVIPGFVITFCYVMAWNGLTKKDQSLRRSQTSVLKSRRRLARMLVAIAILFAISWMPYQVVSLYVDFRRDSKAANFLKYCLLLGHFHSAQNPILYCIMNAKFRRGLIYLFQCKKVCNLISISKLIQDFISSLP